MPDKVRRIYFKITEAGRIRVKKLYTIVPLALALTALTAHADISVSQEKRTVTISGTLDDKTEGQKITITVTDEDGEYIYLGQTSSDKDGKYKVVFSPEEDKDADFDIKVKPANTAISEETKSFTYKKAEVKKPSTSKPSSSGGGGGGGGGGGSVTIPASTPKPQTQPEQTTTPAPAIKPQWLTELGAHWAYNDISALFDKKIIDEEIIPDNTITRLEFVEMICKATNRKAEKYNSIFMDVTDSEEALYLQAAVDAGIIAIDTYFRPNDSITRREMCRVLCLAADIKDLEKGEAFTDEALFGDWAIDHIYNAKAAGLVVGMPDGSFDPLGNVTFAQAAAVTNRIMSK